MGAGRIRKTDLLDYSVGYVLHARIGDRMEADTPFVTLHARTENEADIAEKAIRNAIRISETPVPPASLCHAIVTRKGTELY